ncbi:hypothetical protein JTB14_013924 [Gonioctena quinquepunctata]|nr:hypothetical protein JTB14_013924 [Gonioctena quinquepunctata]
MQLPPVRRRQLSQQPEHKRPATHSWRLFSLVELLENMRQQGDTTSADILNALRVGNIKSERLEVLLGKISTNHTGAEIMLRANTYVEKDLVNGKIGFISDIIWPPSCRDQMYDTDIPLIEVNFGKDGEYSQ